MGSGFTHCDALIPMIGLLTSIEHGPPSNVVILRVTVLHFLDRGLCPLCAALALHQDVVQREPSTGQMVRINFRFVNSNIPNRDSSRPKPDRLTPPNGSSARWTWGG